MISLTDTLVARRRHPMIEVKLAAVARKLRAKQLHRQNAFLWSAIAAGGALALAGRYTQDINIGWATPVLLIFIGVVVFRTWLGTRKKDLDLTIAVRDLETRFPELGHALRTAYEQRSEGGQFTFLQKRVIAEVLEHGNRHVWTPPRGPLRLWRWAHLLAMALGFAALAAVVVSDRTSPGKPLSKPTFFSSQLTVTPGNAEFEKGSVVVITARFQGIMPADAQLVWTTSPGTSHTQTMAKSFSDPLFAFTLPVLQDDVRYRISYAQKSSEEFKLTVYTLPALVRADATLTYPAYTGLAARTIADTRRVSAVEGTELVYEFTLNQPVTSAVLREKNGGDTKIELTPTNPERTRFTTRFPVQRSRQFLLELQDAAGRNNNPPIDLRLEAIPNRRPEPRITSPLGDTRVSPIEEVRLIGTARDEFGLLDYGVAYAIGSSEPEFISLKAAAKPPIEATFSHLLALEGRNLEPGQLITWFAWADDFGPDGQLRRSTGDLQFAEVRPLDEIFREDESGGASQQQDTPGSEEGEELLELQRQISLAIWKQRQQDARAATFPEDLGAIAQSQRHVRSQLTKALEEIRDAAQRKAATAALEHMQATEDRVKSAADSRSVEPLSTAWTRSQAAYQELLKMLPKETRVARMNQRSGSRGSQRGNQRQMNQLDFKQAENRYETQTEAQPITSPEQREQLQALSRLRELSRRQQETNQRLQELQTALNAARDEEQREQIRRELKRLEEEQRRLLADTDELRQRMDQMSPSERTQEARNRLDETREQMRQSSERLERGEVSSALASGTRAAEDLQNLSEDFRKEASSQFADQLRDARRQARELAEQQSAAEQRLKALAEERVRSLDETGPREEISRDLEQLREKRDALLQQLRQVAEDSETSEPGLHRRLYDLLREHGQSGTSEQLSASAEMLRRGFLPQARDTQAEAGRDLQDLRRGVDRAAESVLGDQAAELRYAQNELTDLSKQLDTERTGTAAERPSDSSTTPSERGTAETPATPTDPSPQPSGADTGETPATRAEPSSTPSEVGLGETPSTRAGTSPTGRNRNPAAPRTGQEMAEGLRRMLDELRQGDAGGGGGEGPLTGEGFGEWIERLRTVEELTELPEARQRLAQARERAEAARREFKRHSRPPQWGSVESGIATPLAQARTLLRQELARLENPESLQPIDRDPVPEKYAESVRRYYEALGQ